MSPVKRALSERFESVCRTELERLRRKTAALTPRERAEVDALTVEVARAIASRLGAALDHPRGGDLAPVVLQLFAAVPADSQPSSEESRS